MSNESRVVKGLLNRWTNESEPELAPMWGRVRYNIWKRMDNTVMCTLQWAPMQVDIATFVVPDDIPDADPITDQKLVWNKPGRRPLLLPVNTCKLTEFATVPEVVDAFLSGDWTPHWMCHTCRKRMTFKIRPE